MELKVCRYQPELASQWSQVLDESKNGLFLFERPYVEYHNDRFVDLSMLAFMDDKPVAVFPVARDPHTNEVISHPGLTFGGIPLRRDLRGDVAITIIHALLDGLKNEGVRQLTIKLLPQVFANYPSSELDYALWRRGFSLSRRDLSSVLPLPDGLSFNTVKRQAVAKAKKNGVSVSRTNACEFHKLLSKVLEAQHGAKPVHSAEELELLASRFPDKMFIVGAWVDGRLLAGSMIFRYGHVWHTQYLASSDEGRECGALDHVISEVKHEAIAAGAKYLSFGTSTKSAGIVLNEGLLWQKESFGARSITHDFMSGTL